MKRKFGLKKPSPAMVVGFLALVLALGGTAVAKHGHDLKLGMFNDSSRDRLAGTGVIQYAAAAHVTPAASPSFNTVHRFEVKCELSKKATSGGFSWTGTPPEAPGADPADNQQPAWQLVDAYPNGSGFVVRMQIAPDDADPATAAGTALNKPLSVYSNCVKSRTQRGTPPA